MAREKDVSDFERGFSVGARMADGKTAQLAALWIGTVTEVTSTFMNGKDISEHLWEILD